ncbi:PREDICTED: uncharacterized protein LOC109229692 isoform X2 [Nicotiana attenuata]|uniref:uncharacterized protein LOC109229692 isoform X2 n=1 Tax=Nicotiana attenuata TaxID=49451 RepID=UPI000904CDE1|nr:PREDICTED: uncharacterized protein LOC109229692 isoform X2 [Nicotiana attenuata]
MNNSFPQQSPKMNPELQSRVTRVADEFASTEFFQFPKDRAGPLFQSAETNTMFILTAHLKGYTRGNIKIDINVERKMMVITCEKPVQETVMVGWTVIKKDVEIRKFTKAFRIPNGAILDQIMTNFYEEESVLTITMPKREKGIVGIGIQEVKEPELVKEMPQKPLEEKALAEQVSQEREMQFPGFPSNIQKVDEDVKKHGAKDEVPRMETEMPKVEQKSQKIDNMVEETRETHSNQIGDDKLESKCLKDDRVCEKANGIQEEEKTGEEDEEKLPQRRSKMFVPVVAGSAVILSLVVFAIHFMRNKNRPEKRKG